MATQKNSGLERVKDLYLRAVLEGDGVTADKVISDALREGHFASELILRVLMEAQKEIGVLWHRGEIGVADEHRATEITASQLHQLRVHLPRRPDHGYKAVVATVEGETHDLGARVVADFLRMDGWSVEYLGLGLPAEELGVFVQREQPHLLALSVTTTQVVEQARRTLSHVKRVYPTLKIMIGGSAAVANREQLVPLGVDTVAEDALDAVERARGLVGLALPSLSLENYLRRIGQSIQMYRKLRTMSQHDLAGLADLDRAYISLVENGKQNVTIGALLRVATALKVSIGDLLVERPLAPSKESGGD